MTGTAGEVDNDGDPNGQEVRQQMFDACFATRKSDGGHGLGLAIVAKIINSHGGLITVTSEYGQTKFAVSIPAIPE